MKKYSVLLMVVTFFAATATRASGEPLLDKLLKNRAGGKRSCLLNLSRKGKGPLFGNRKSRATAAVARPAPAGDQDIAPEPPRVPKKKPATPKSDAAPKSESATDSSAAAPAKAIAKTPAAPKPATPSQPPAKSAPTASVAKSSPTAPAPKSAPTAPAKRVRSRASIASVTPAPKVNAPIAGQPPRPLVVEAPPAPPVRVNSPIAGDPPRPITRASAAKATPAVASRKLPTIEDLKNLYKDLPKEGTPAEDSPPQQ